MIKQHQSKQLLSSFHWMVTLTYFIPTTSISLLLQPSALAKLARNWRNIQGSSIFFFEDLNFAGKIYLFTQWKEENVLGALEQFSIDCRN